TSGVGLRSSTPRGISGMGWMIGSREVPTTMMAESIAMSPSTDMRAAPRIRTAWSPADTSHQGAFSMSFMARSSIFRLFTQVLHGLGKADGGQLLVLAEVDDVDDVLPGD